MDIPKKEKGEKIKRTIEFTATNYGLVKEKAKKEGKTPQEFTDEVASEIKRIWDLMNTSYDKFVRTTDKEHEKIVQNIFQKLYDQGDIYLGEYEG